MKKTTLYAAIIVAISSLINNSILYGVFKLFAHSYNFMIGYFAFAALYVLLLLFIRGAHDPIEDWEEYNMNIKK